MLGFLCRVLLRPFLTSRAFSAKEMATHSGVFIRSNRSDDGFNTECLRSLNRMMKPAEKICGVSRDQTYGGLRVYFKDASTVRNILREKNLTILGEQFSIHPLTTALIVHTELFDLSDDFENLLRDGLQHMGSVLQISRLPFVDEFPDAFSGDWKVVLDVPEIEDLDVFAPDESSDDMVLRLPDHDGEYRVTFCCFFCGKDGHTLRGCNAIGNVARTPAATQSIRIDSFRGARVDESAGISSSQGASEFRIRDAEEEKSQSGANAPVKPKIKPKKIESWARMFGEEKVRQQFIDSYLDSNRASVIKQEHDPDSEECLVSNKRSADGKDDAINYDLLAKKPRGSNFMDEESSVSNPGPSTSDNGDIEVLFQKRVPPRAGIPTGLFRSNSIEAPGSSNQEEPGQVSTSSRPEGIIDSFKSEMPSTDDNDSDSSLSRTKPAATAGRTPKRRKPTQFRQITIPEAIKDIIRKNQGVLDEKELEAFFNHVKKKACPSAVAKQYTANVQELKDQLQRIKDQYYYTPIIHSAEDKYFMKWFENVLLRFDRKPSKRIKSAVSQ